MPSEAFPASFLEIEINKYSLNEKREAIVNCRGRLVLLKDKIINMELKRKGTHHLGIVGDAYTEEYDFLMVIENTGKNLRLFYSNLEELFVECDE